MKHLLMAVIISIACCTTFIVGGCATIGTTPQTEQQLAAQSLEAIGETIKAVPATMDTLARNGKITNSQYNEVVLIYNQAKSAYALAVDAMVFYVQSGIPSDSIQAEKRRATLDAVFKQLSALIATYGGNS